MSASNKIAKLTELKSDSSISSYPHVKNILKNQIIPIPFLKYKPSKLVRYRRHNNGEIFFKNLEDISYRTDILNIKDFGRGNEPGQGFFYCNDNLNDSTGITEAISVFRGNSESEEEILTVGAWNLKESLILAMILPIKEHSGKNEEFDKMKKFYVEFDKGEEFEEVKKFNEFLAREFTLDLQKHKSNYKISCAFTNYIKESFPHVDGVMYASVKFEYEGTNIVLWPEVVDKKVEFVAARKRVFKKTADKTFVELHTYDNRDFDSSTGTIFWE